jgi:hypothetical protein
MVWAMKRKRNPIGEIIKWKARLCAGGHRSIENIDYWSTYSPVVSWSTVHIMIIFALLNDWHLSSSTGKNGHLHEASKSSPKLYHSRPTNFFIQAHQSLQANQKLVRPKRRWENMGGLLE